MKCASVENFTKLQFRKIFQQLRLVENIQGGLCCRRASEGNVRFMNIYILFTCLPCMSGGMFAFSRGLATPGLEYDVLR